MLLLPVLTGAAAGPTGARTIPVEACPPTITVEQTVAPPAGWRSDRSKGPTRFSALTFYNGPVAGLGQLRETDVHRQGNATIYRWVFEAPLDVIHLACLYSGTDIVLSRPLPAGIRQCTSREDRVTHAVDPAPVCQ